ncbi:hypothetical protein J7E78_16675 [Paenibacillus polymyxa]|uniref:hypothetical protein n=1 Tax=Paenibacillus polymyxa TaxID=1406 RepID=UPI001BE4EE5E|nr:hypothetical protein [Paenibacillus polymyxa]MBT2285177.1 hypothetical protein [Paenibacillus polymyxa]
MDKKKKTYYGKEHEFNKAEEMMEALLKKENFLQDWLGYCELLISNNLKIEYRPTLGRIDHDRGYTLDNIEVQMYSNNTSSSTRQRFSKGCITVVTLEKSMEVILFESASGKDAIDKINKVTDIEITRSLLRGNLTSGLRRSNKEYSVLIIGKESLMGTPEKIEFSFPVTAIHDEKHNILIARPNDSVTKVDIYIDEKDVVRID